MQQTNLQPYKQNVVKCHLFFCLPTKAIIFQEKVNWKSDTLFLNAIFLLQDL